MALSGDALIEAVAELRAQHGAMVARFGGIDASIQELRADSNEKHKENRESIHNLRDGQQSIVESVHTVDAKVVNGINSINLKFERITGYAIGAGAVVGTAITLLMKLLDHVWK